MPNLERIAAELRGYDPCEPFEFDADRAAKLVVDWMRERRLGRPEVIRTSLSLVDALGEVAGTDRNEKWPTYKVRSQRVARAVGASAYSRALKIVARPAQEAVEDIVIMKVEKTKTVARGWATYRDEHYGTAYILDRLVSVAESALVDNTMLEAFKCGLGWIISVDRNVVLVPMPVIVADEWGRPHNEAGPSVMWRDGKEWFHLNGAELSKKVGRKLTAGTLRFSDVMAVRNADLRSKLMMIVPIEELLAECTTRLIDIGSKGTRLYEVQLPDFEGPQYLMQMIDASTPREFFEWVPPEVGHKGNAELCQAHAFGITLAQWHSIGMEG